MDAEKRLRPALRLNPKADRRVSTGHPWVFSNEIAMDEAAAGIEPGSVVRIESASGKPLGTFTFNRHALIAARRLSDDPDAEIDIRFFVEKIGRALELRNRTFEEPFYRLVHAEADKLPGTVIDRYGDAIAVQPNTAGAQMLIEPLLGALDELLSPKTVVLRSDAPARALEQLESSTSVVRGDLNGPVQVKEGGAVMLADLVKGQKTGWFYDQRETRDAAALLASRIKPAPTVLDLYCYTGAFALRSVVAGAGRAIGIDRSRPALELAAEASRINGVSEKCRFEIGDAFEVAESMSRDREKFDIVVADPPAFARSKRETNQALRAYRKLARLGAGLVAPRGFLFLCSCSHHVDRQSFVVEAGRGIRAAGRTARLIRSKGAGPDHPVDPLLPESEYLKSLLFALD